MLLRSNFSAFSANRILPSAQELPSRKKTVQSPAVTTPSTEGGVMVYGNSLFVYFLSEKITTHTANNSLAERLWLLLRWATVQSPRHSPSVKSSNIV